MYLIAKNVYSCKKYQVQRTVTIQLKYYPEAFVWQTVNSRVGGGGSFFFFRLKLVKYAKRVVTRLVMLNKEFRFH